MSRTRHGSKGPGYDYWSRRPGTHKCPFPGKFAKRLNARKERQQNKREVRWRDE